MPTAQAFDRTTYQFLLAPFGLTAISWLVAMAFHTPRSMLTLGAFAVSALSGVATLSVLPFAVRQLAKVPVTRILPNVLSVVFAVIPLAFSVLAALLLLVVLIGG